MSEKLMIIPCGAMLTISTGEYSDYYVRGVFKAAKEIDANKLRDDWLSLHPEQKSEYHFDESEFLAWVALNGYIEPIDTYSWHLSNYSKIDEMEVNHDTSR